MNRRQKGLTGALAVLASGGMVVSALAAPAAYAEPAPQTQADLKADIDKILEDPRLNGAKVGVVVRRAGNGEVLYTRGADEQVTPASNNKLHTSAAALGILGAGYRFRTTVHAEADGSAVKGNLYLRGKGDPTMRAEEYDKLAAAVAAKGIKKVEGKLIVDDTWFDDKRTAPDWDPTDLPYAYATQVSALTIAPDEDYDAGALKVVSTPGKEGEPVKVELTPKTSVIKIDNQATTGKAGSEPTLSVERQVPGNTILVKGSLPEAGEADESWTSVDNPTLYAADVFRNALKAHGVEVTGTTERGKKPGGVDRIALRKSIPLSELNTPFMKMSNNPIAETLVKAIGRKTAGKGSWEAGLPAVKRYVRGLGVTDVTMTDGSGLANTNKATTGQTSALLRAAQKRTWFPAFRHALPVAGNPDPKIGGTLSSRMRGTAAENNVRAKTGTLTGATALSGYVTDPDKTPLIFSIIFNGYQGSPPRDLQDKIAVRLAGGSVPAAVPYTQAEDDRKAKWPTSRWEG